MYHGFDIEGEIHDVQLARTAKGYRLYLGERTCAATLVETGDALATLTVDGQSMPVYYARRGDDVYIHLDGQNCHLRYRHPLTRLASLSGASADDHVKAPMPGAVVSVLVAPGEVVVGGQALLVMESMKMETTITAARDGVVQSIHYNVAQTFAQDAVLVTLEPNT